MRLPLTTATHRTSTRPPSHPISHPPGHPPTHRASRRGGGVLNVAHRGASSEVAENTLAAVRRAVELGADLVEIDVRRSKDGALVLMHDATLTRTTDVQRVFPRRAPWRVGDFTYDELKRLDAGSWRASTFEGERVATLEEVLDVIGPSKTGLLLELKSPELYPGIVADVVAQMRDLRRLVDPALAEGRMVVQSFDVAAMKEHKTLAPSVPVGLLGTASRANLPALGTWADQLNPSHFSVDKGYVDQVHRAGMQCLVWTVDRPPAMRRALRIGVDGVITNRPSSLKRLLEGREPARSGRAALPR
ncbi:MAG TPA: glycerophosphodiester phosphodiesterase family protein [Nocardioidaceae bacterium]|nr:glycerophosphodiester phosphodiesterase family protein [Nocardioidaceae bacterium]